MPLYNPITPTIISPIKGLFNKRKGPPTFGGPAVSGGQFSPTLKNDDITLTASDRTATKSASTVSTTSTVLTATSHSVGKWQFEATAVVVGASNSGLGVSGDPTPVFDQLLGSASGLAAEPSSSYQKLGRVYWNLSSGDSNAFISGFNYVAGDIISVCLDLDAATPEAHYYKNGVFVYTKVLEVALAYRAGVCMAAIGDEFTIPSGDLAFPISGFTPWS